MAVRGVRNKNPGCLRCQGTAGRDSGGFAIYNTWEEGYYALNSVLYRMYNGKSLRQIFRIYAPASERGNNPSSYSAQVARSLKAAGINVSVDQPLDLSDPRIRAEVVCGIAKVECGKIPQGREFALAQSMAYNPMADSRVNRNGRSSSARMARRATQSPTQRPAQAADRKPTREGVHAGTSAKPAVPQRENDVPSNGVEPTAGVVGIGQGERVERPPRKLTWLERLLPPFLGGATKEACLLDDVYYPKGRARQLVGNNEVFLGVTVDELRTAGFSDEKIASMQARIDLKYERARGSGLLSTLGTAGLKMNAQELDVSNDEIQRIAMLSKNDSRMS